MPNYEQLLENSLFTLIKQDSYNLNLVDQELLNNKEFIMKIIVMNIDCYSELSDNWKNDKDIAMLACKSKDPYIFREFSKELQDDYDIALSAISLNGRMLEYVSKRLQNNKELVLTAIKNNADLQYASPALRADKEIVYAAIVAQSANLAYVDRRFKKDRDLVMHAVKNNGMALALAHPKLRDDTDIVRTAILENALSLKYASPRLLDDKDTVMLALKNVQTTTDNLLSYVSVRLKQDPDIMLASIKRYPTQNILRYAPERITNVDILLTAIYISNKNKASVPKDMLNTPAIQFMVNNKKEIKKEHLDIIKEALLKQQDLFLNPPEIIKVLADGNDDKYLIYAQNALKPEHITSEHNIDLPML